MGLLQLLQNWTYWKVKWNYETKFISWKQDARTHKAAIDKCNCLKLALFDTFICRFRSILYVIALREKKNSSLNCDEKVVFERSAREKDGASEITALVLLISTRAVARLRPLKSWFKNTDRESEATERGKMTPKKF
jgi:hypothetical protein